MKAPLFDYAKPRSLSEVFELLATWGDEARLLAGGQTLLATLNMRLSEPAMLIDINGIAELKGISVQRGDGGGEVLRIGALVTHSEIEASELVARHAPLLALAVPHIAHRAIRNLGTWGGSIAYADPAAEWPTCLAALEGVVVLRSVRGERRVAAQDFFLDLYTTALAEGEIVAACELPLCRHDDRFVFDELARRHGDYAIVGRARAAGLSRHRHDAGPRAPRRGRARRADADAGIDRRGHRGAPVRTEPAGRPDEFVGHQTPPRVRAGAPRADGHLAYRASRVRRSPETLHG